MALLIIAALPFVFVAGGMPVLRHDWFPSVPGWDFAVANVTGWDPTGVGAPIGYPSSFLIVFARSIVAAVLGPYVAHATYFVAYGLLVAFGAARLSRVLGAPPPACAAAAAFAAFNPWTYVQTVAGHTFMLLSYAATYWLIAECCSRSRNRLRLIALAVVIAPQIQFLVVDAGIYALLSLRLRTAVVPAAIGAVLLPVIVGVATSRHALLGIPVTLAWERDQSLFPFDALVFRGYFTHYADAMATVANYGMWAVVVIALGGVAILVSERRGLSWLVAFTAIPLIWTFGLRGPFAAAFAWLIARIPELALFRELYDLLGFVAIGYVAFCSVAAARVRGAAALWCAAAALLFAGWLVAPPSHSWVSAGDVPRVAVPAATNARFLLLPALAPLQLGERGSGVDPDLYARSSNRTPINEALPTYPVAPALGRLLRDGDARPLAALGAAAIVRRRALHTDASLAGQLALPPQPWLLRSDPHLTKGGPATPELTICAFPRIASLASNVGAGSVLFSDARDASAPDLPSLWKTYPTVRRVGGTGEYVRAADGWVDARFAFLQLPEIAQSYGGVVTTNPRALLHLEPGGFLLVWTDGELVDQVNRRVDAHARRFHWIGLRPSVYALRCRGTCVVAAGAASLPHDVPLNAPASPFREVPFVARAPWYVDATIPEGSERLLRYEVTYDDRWTAYAPGVTLTHLRVDGVFNGWLIPRRERAMRVTLVETGAAAVTLAEVSSIVLILVLAGSAAKRGGVGKRSRRISVAGV